MTTPPPPQAPLGMSDFFALEAGEYLERLDALLAAGDHPNVEELVRLARALRGSALMASQTAIARTAAGLEALARAVREGQRVWDANSKPLAVRAVDDLKIFVRRAASWTDADTAKAEALAQELEQLAGRPSAQVRAAEAIGLDAGARAFVAREGAAIASALDRASQALRANPIARDPLQHVQRALQPLRGLAAVTDLPPLPDLLEGIDRAIGDLAHSGLEPPANLGGLLQAGAVAIARAAREVAEKGRPDPDGAQFRQFAALLVGFLESEPDVVSIGSLYYSDSGPHIVSRGVPAARPSTLGRLELVSHGEHLRQAADSLERAPSATQRELRAHTLAATFRALADAGAGALSDHVARFATAAREAVTSGVAVSNPAAFATEMRRAGDLLAGAGDTEEETLARELDALATTIRGIRPGVAATARPAPPAPTAPPRAAPPPAAVAPRAAAPPPNRPPPTPADAAPPESADLVGSWATYQGLAQDGIQPASLEELIAGAGRVPTREPSRDTARPPASAPRELSIVDVRTLLYRGDRALKRAQELRAAAKQASGDTLRALVDEVCDLVALALEPNP